MGGTAAGPRVTIADVAKHAGVSTAAVSKVLRNAYGVSPAMDARVRASIAALSYRPHAGARAMRGRSYTLGVLLDNIRNPFYGDILDGVTDALTKSDYQVLVGSGGFNSDTQMHMGEAMVDRGMDGLILVAPAMSRDQVRAVATTVPVVVVGHHDGSDAYDTVVGDDAAGASLVVDHLTSLGHRRIAHTSVAATKGTQWRRRLEQVRSTGYSEAMQRHNLDRFIKIVATSYYSEEGGYSAALELLGGRDRPTAIFAGADIAAFGVIRAAAELGLRIPEDLSLVGYDNTNVASLEPIQLTSVDQGGSHIGQTAVQLLLERIGGRVRSVRTSTAPSLIVRKTTGAPPRK